MIAASAWADPEMPETTAEVSWQTYAIPPRRCATSEAAKAIRRIDMPLLLSTSATIRNIRITSSSLPPDRPMVNWETEKGTNASVLG